MPKKTSIFTGLVLCLAVLGFYYSHHKATPVISSTDYIDGLGNVLIARPVWGAKASARVFVDAGKFSAEALAQHLAETGLSAAIIDTREFFKHFNPSSQQCLDMGNLSRYLDKIDVKIPASKDKAAFVAGIGDGSLIPFINAQQAASPGIINLSSGFSTELPLDLSLCPPFDTAKNEHTQVLISAPGIKTKWRSV